ncbi:Pls/PosA family non-ribosomal peptide synthetase [Saccharopolyspora taberi]|uniref:Carrier domain-containing protein n=1 Tax=Saccharopolyspora taberi TaxID=60895 RepID=A0ABN3V252_9PSEU
MPGHPVEVAPDDLTDNTTTPVGTEQIFAEVLAGVVRTEQVSVHSNFFDDLGADSMVMAQFCARVRKRDDLPSVSMKDVYRHPTISSLATALSGDEAPAAPAPEPARVAEPVSRAQHLLCGTLQLLAFLLLACVGSIVLTAGFEWISEGAGVVGIYLRALLFTSVTFTAACVLPILAKWTIIGRWKPREIRIWSLDYFRFWFVKTLVRANPLALFTGSPLNVLYLRLLGARVGRGVVILTRHLPVCTDLVSIGAGTVVRKDAYVQSYRAHSGMIQTGPVSLGENVFVGEASVVDIGTSMGDGSLLGRSSSLHAGQAVPAGERWHGSPAQRTGMEYPAVEPARCGTLRRAVYATLQLVVLLSISLPLVTGGATMLLTGVPRLAQILQAGELAFTSWAFWREALAVSLLLFFGALVVGLLTVATIPRLLNLAITPGKAYRLYGIRFWAQRAIARMTNSKFLMLLFGDSSYVVPYLRWIGYRLTPVVQTGSNFGTEVKHDNPFVTTVGSGTMVADGLSVINAEYSNTSFRVAEAKVGPHNFLGNHIVYPPGGRTGDDCLLATKVMVPIDGKVREGVGLLGAPSMEIPRTVQRDKSLEVADHERHSRLRIKNRHNLATIGWFLLVRWVHLFVVTVLAGAAADLYGHMASWSVALATVLVLLFTVAYNVLVDRIVTKVHPQRPMFCSIYDLRFWRHERYWKVPETDYLAMFNGTAFKPLLWRLMGARVGKRVFDDGCYISERRLTAIGDDAILNVGSKIQCHSQEDGSFKSDHSELGSRCTVGISTLVHYGVTVGDDAVLGPDSFLMKGEYVPDQAQWVGNPARELAGERAVA